jgi:2-methylfumaryl-CoA isomerase
VVRGAESADFAKMFDEAGVTWSVFRDFATALAEDPDLSLQNPMFSRIEQPGIGAYRVPGTPMSFTGEARETPVRAPVLGEHTEEILGDVAGLPDVEIAALFDTGIVAQAVRPGDGTRMAC